MRSLVVRAGTALTTALMTAAVADAVTEFAVNLGWLGGSVRDAQHEAIAPTFLIGLAIGTALAAFVAFARITPRDPLLRSMSGLHALVSDPAIALAGSALCTIAMEGYETRFGGLSPFDPRSVVCSHALALLVAFVVVAPIVWGIIGKALYVARNAGECATSAIGQFLQKIFQANVGPETAHTSAFTLHVVHLSPAIADGVYGLRAPPRSIYSGCSVT
ncbi:MAG: hypothetical protein WBW76_12400 [Candidatus Cybelea sp.]